jgi:formate hydrogenlyase transcriptional activator
MVPNVLNGLNSLNVVFSNSATGRVAPGKPLLATKASRFRGVIAKIELDASCSGESLSGRSKEQWRSRLGELKSGAKEKNNMLDMSQTSAGSEKRTDGFAPGRVFSQRNFDEVVGRSAALRAVLEQAEIVAPTDSTVLILGETGTGKELVARAIHSLSERRGRALVKVNCAAIPSGLLESELFGHEKGAFTGAIAQRIGRFELANGGTLFLDEVGDMPIELQPKLLRVLQEQDFERLGSTRTSRVDVRVVAATNADLAQKVADKQFRDDLYYRLNVFPIKLPALRERREDIPLLVHYFVQKYARRMKKPVDTIPATTMTALTEYHWPGNVRELENFIERAVILSSGAKLETPLSELAQRRKLPAVISADNSITLEEAQREHIVRALRDTNWVVGGPTGAAARLGTKRTTLQTRIKKLGIKRFN